MKYKALLQLSALGILVCLAACSPKKEATTTETPQADTMKSVTKTAFGTTPDGKEVFKYTLTNKNGLELAVINYGAIVVSLKTPDKQGNLGDIVLGHDSLSSYLKASSYFGAIVGRYGNRIAKGKFAIDGTVYNLAVNNDPNHLHGGLKGFDKVFWDIEEVASPDGPTVKLTYQSKDGEEGYPGNLSTEVIYTLNNNNEWVITYKATTDKKTVVNLTQHTYFNLAADASKDILSHELRILSDKFLPVDKGLIPPGELKPVANTPFDFNKPTAIGARINDKDTQIEYGKGYDHCWVLTKTEGLFAASVYEPTSGRYLEVMTTEPGIQFYSGNFLDGSAIGKGGVSYKQRHGLCLETEHYPDSPNKKDFPTTLLEPGQVYSTTTTYKFSVK